MRRSITCFRRSVMNLKRKPKPETKKESVIDSVGSDLFQSRQKYRNKRFMPKPNSPFLSSLVFFLYRTI